MKASHLIKALQDAIDIHGDIDCVTITSLSPFLATRKPVTAVKPHLPVLPAQTPHLVISSEEPADK
jgi:hypothetical protein